MIKVINGKFTMLPFKPCPICKGRGKIRTVKTPPVANLMSGSDTIPDLEDITVYKDTPCPKCFGKGKVIQRPCGALGDPNIIISKPHKIVPPNINHQYCRCKII